MATLTLKGVPDALLARVRREAEAERRSLNQHVIHLLEQSVPARPVETFAQFLDRFQAEWGPGDLGDSNFDGLRSDEEFDTGNPFDAP